MGKVEALLEILARREERCLLADGFEDALIGLSATTPGRKALAVYDYDKCIDILVRQEGMDRDEAVEFFEFNTIGAWVGEGTPVFVSVLEEETE